MTRVKFDKTEKKLSREGKTNKRTLKHFPKMVGTLARSQVMSINTGWSKYKGTAHTHTHADSPTNNVPKPGHKQGKRIGIVIKYA